MSTNKFVNWFFASRLRYHAAFWLIYSGFWHFASAPTPFTLGSIAISSIIMVCHWGSVYTNHYILMPKYLYKRDYWVYSGLLLVNLIIYIFLLGSTLWLFIYLIYPNLLPVFFAGEVLLSSILASTVGTTFLAMGIKLAKRQIETDQRNQQLEKSNLTTELKFLRSQFNPHFLFNGLNNIYFMIKKDPDKAAESLATFSDILRYQLYECNEDKISLEQEVNFIENYIKFAELRQNRVLIETQWSEKINGQPIAPLLLLPMVENAFKHASDTKEQDNFIRFRLDIQKNQLLFHAQNTYEDQKKTDMVGGIGLNNLKRRLELLYPNKHEFVVKKEDQVFEANLQLEIS